MINICFTQNIDSPLMEREDVMEPKRENRREAIIYMERYLAREREERERREKKQQLKLERERKKVLAQNEKMCKICFDHPINTANLSHLRCVVYDTFYGKECTYFRICFCFCFCFCFFFWPWPLFSKNKLLRQTHVFFFATIITLKYQV
jgi:hypothetical protein